VRQVHSATEKANGSKESSPAHGESSNLANGDLESNIHVAPGLSAEYIAAVRIQDAFRAYKVHFNGVIIHTYIHTYIYIYLLILAPRTGFRGNHILLSTSSDSVLN
jgi:hypothetical protein